jgi:DedD protein
MASRGNRGGGGDRVLESRHVIGLFMLMLVFSGVFFALGYVMGRNQYDGQVRAAMNPRATPDPVVAPKSDVNPRHSKNSSSPSGTSSASNTSSSGWGSSSASPASSGGSATSSGNSSTTSATDSASDEAPPTSDWGFYNAGKGAPDDRLKPASGDPSATVTPSAVPAVATGKNPRPTNVASRTANTATAPGTVSVPAGAFVLQVAALRKDVDANSVASSLRTKKFPAFVVNPTTDKYYHVQVGPYHDLKSAEAAKKGLESAGFKAIVKH